MLPAPVDKSPRNKLFIFYLLVTLFYLNVYGIKAGAHKSKSCSRFENAASTFCHRKKGGGTILRGGAKLFEGNAVCDICVGVKHLSINIQQTLNSLLIHFLLPQLLFHFQNASDQSSNFVLIDVKANVKGS